ncbi:MAG: hypothetical protein FJ301_02785 [Planctomycetes bacterium]|nr:hypothetical protein [Planctomycetota bacterium]
MAPQILRPEALLSGLFCALAACTGPSLRLDEQSGHPLFLDGRAAAAGERPYRYYGTTVWDALPRDVDGRADWSNRPTRGMVAVPPPAPLWLFPFDLPIELIVRALSGRPDQTAAVRVDAAAPDPRGEDEIVNVELAGLAARARAARASR